MAESLQGFICEIVRFAKSTYCTVRGCFDIIIIIQNDSEKQEVYTDDTGFKRQIF